MPATVIANCKHVETHGYHGAAGCSNGFCNEFCAQYTAERGSDRLESRPTPSCRTKCLSHVAVAVAAVNRVIEMEMPENIIPSSVSIRNRPFALLLSMLQPSGMLTS